MKIDEKIKEIGKVHSLKNPKDIERKNSYIKKLKEKGILRKREYNLPQVDTIGKIYFSPGQDV